MPCHKKLEINGCTSLKLVKLVNSNPAIHPSVLFCIVCNCCSFNEIEFLTKKTALFLG